MRAGAAGGSETPSRAVRVFVGVFLAAFVVCGFGGIEAWPLSGWRLFSAVRHERVRAWIITTIDGGGVEHPLPIHELGAAYRGFPQVAAGLATLTAEERAAVCHAWAGGVRGLGRTVREVRVYETDRHLSDRVGSAGAAGVRTLRHRCPAGRDGS